jgi:large subunit ribosomal protein L23
MAKINTQKNTQGTILSPRVTEKGTITITTSNAYVFNVDKRSTKKEIAKSFKEIYKLEPIKIAVLNVRAKNVVAKGIKGKTSSYKKAYVYLKKGDSINVI